MIIVAKTGQRVPYNDEVEAKEDLTTQIKQARQAAADKEEDEEEKEERDSQEVSAFLHPGSAFTMGCLLALFFAGAMVRFSLVQGSRPSRIGAD